MEERNEAIILASGSPRRRELLARLGLPFSVVVSEVDETIELAQRVPEALARLAERKARAVAASVGHGLVIGADTAVVRDGAILGKPRDEEDAKRLLRLLRDRAHHVVTGVAVMDAATGRVERGAARTEVRMRAYGDDEIAAYVATGEPLDKAGGYGIQARGGALVAAIAGCFNNVVGLPLCEVAELLRRFGVLPRTTGPACMLPTGDPCPRLPRGDPSPDRPG